ncbi:hypothetical protein EVAR_49993_1 [Eumeta japonica]|uniref:Uncharacterized protein n=1 Tax=Eumeta variegata TaxID=151549 RepID=A0A4C1XMM7_EUMVA|nr:hypothetical protein EVAR_49993_1 [Eumeta japonica]
MLWSSWLQHKNGPARSIKCHTLTEYKGEANSFCCCISLLRFVQPMGTHVMTFPAGSARVLMAADVAIEHSRAAVARIV